MSDQPEKKTEEKTNGKKKISPKRKTITLEEMTKEQAVEIIRRLLEAIHS